MNVSIGAIQCGPFRVCDPEYSVIANVNHSILTVCGPNVGWRNQAVGTCC
jgi:hypothetical protein